MKSPKAVIIGAGHNGLTAAFYLARAGWNVTVLEARRSIGGACCSTQLECGCIISPGANHFGMLRPEIRIDMQLAARGLEIIVPDPQMVVTFETGRNLALYRDIVRTQQEIARFSAADARAFVSYAIDLSKAASVLNRHLLATPPQPDAFAEELDRVQSGFGQRFFRGSLAETLRHYFESPYVQTAMGAAAFLYRAGPETPGTAFALTYLAQYDVGGEPGWGFARGGMGRVTELMADATFEAGATIRTETRVHRICIGDCAAVGVELDNGTFFPAEVVLSNADPYTTYCRLLPDGVLPSPVQAHLESSYRDGACSKLNLLVDRPPVFSVCSGYRAEEAARSLLVYMPSLAFIESALQDCVGGTPAKSPYLEVVCPSLLDPTVSCGRHHTLSVFILFTPYSLATGQWEAVRDSFRANVLARLEELAPGLKQSVIWSEFLSPVDLEDRFGMYHGNVDHGDMALGNLLAERPLGSCALSLPAVRSLYLCGAGAHPGGLVSGAPGYNAAMQTLTDWLRRDVA